MTKMTVDDYVLEQLERLSDPELSNEELETELKRSDAISKLAKCSIENKEADIKSAELEVKQRLINYQYGKNSNNITALLQLPRGLDDEEV